MAYVRPYGTISWAASPSQDIIQYHLYIKEADTSPPENTQFDRSHVVRIITAEPGKLEYSVPLSSFYGLLGKKGATMVVAIAAEDSEGHVSELSNAIVIPLTADCPDPPADFTYTP